MKCSLCGFRNKEGNEICENCKRPLNKTKNSDVSNKEFLKSKNEINKEDLDKTVILSDKTVLNDSIKINSDNNFKENNKVNKSKKKTSKNKRNLAIVLALILFLALTSLIYFGIVYFNPSSKKIFSNFTNSLYSSLKSATKDEYNSIYFDMALSTNVSGTDSTELENIINKFDIQLNGGIDYKNKTFIYNFKTNYNNKELINIDAQYNKNLYLIFNDLYDKPIEFVDNDFTEIFEKTNNEDVNTVAKGLVDAFNNSLDDSYFTSSNKEIDYNGKKVKAKVTTLKLNKNNIEEIQNKMADNLKNNDEFIKAYSNVYEIKESEIKESLNSGELNSSNLEDLSEDIDINLYTIGLTNEFAKIEFVTSDMTVEITSKEDNTYVVVAKNKDITMTLNIKYSQEFDKKIVLKDVSGAINEDTVGEEFVSALGNIVNTEGYIELNKDVEAATGFGIEDLFLNLFGVGSIYDEAYNNTYGYDDYDYNYNYDEEYDLDYDYNSGYDTYYDDYSTYETFNS